MIQFKNASLQITCDNNARIRFVGAPKGKSLLREAGVFARLEFFTPSPAFANELVAVPPHSDPVYVPAANAAATDTQLVIGFEDGAKAVFDVAAKTDCLLFKMTAFAAGSNGMPTALRFAQLPLHTNGTKVCIGMALNMETDAAGLPGIGEFLWAKAYSHIGLIGASYAIAMTDRSALRKTLQKMTKAYTQNVPYLSCAGAFAQDAPSVRNSYVFSLGNYRPGGLSTRNLDEWIAMIQALGMKQVDFHGAEGGNFLFGSFEPNTEMFPEGKKSVKYVIDRLHAVGVQSGLHTYSSLIDPRSSLVTPIPHKGLGVNRTFKLAQDLDMTGDRICIEEGTKDISLTHNSGINNSTYVWIDDEIIQFQALGEHSLENCKRSMFGTRQSAHRKGAPVRNLKRMYNLFAPDAGGELFMQVAQNTADFYDECGFDMIYFDALEGVRVLEGTDFQWYYNVKFVWEVARRVKSNVPIMEMSSMNHNLWFTRARDGAWDRPAAAHKAVLERHSELNQICQSRSTLPQHIGWWYLGSPDRKPSTHVSRMHADVYDYMGRLSIAYEYSQSFHDITLDKYKKSPELQRFATVIKKYEDLRLNDVLTPKQRAAITKTECRLLSDGFHAVSYVPDSVTLKGGEAAVCVRNPFEAGRPDLVRIEPLMSKKPGGGVITLLDPERDFAALRVISSNNVKASIAPVKSPNGGAVRLRARQDGKIGCSRFMYEYPSLLNANGKYGLGIWVRGDGKGEILDIQVKSPRIVSSSPCDRIIKVDFTGWRYIELFEHSSDTVMQYLWPFYHRNLDTKNVFRPKVEEHKGIGWTDSMYDTDRASGNPWNVAGSGMDFARIHSISVWINGMVSGKQYEVAIGAITAFDVEQLTFDKIALGDLQINGALPPDSYLEYDGKEWYAYDIAGQALDVAVSGAPGKMAKGKNSCMLRAGAPDDARMRVTYGFIAQKPLVKIANRQSKPKTRK